MIVAEGVANAWTRSKAGSRVLGRREACLKGGVGVGERCVGCGSKEAEPGSELRLSRVELQKDCGQLGAESRADRRRGLL